MFACMEKYRFICDLYFQPCRHLSLHEYISRELMLQYNVAVPKGAVASAPEAAREIADRLGMNYKCRYTIATIRVNQGNSVNFFSELDLQQIVCYIVMYL